MACSASGEAATNASSSGRGVAFAQPRALGVSVVPRNSNPSCSSTPDKAQRTHERPRNSALASEARQNKARGADDLLRECRNRRITPCERAGRHKSRRARRTRRDGRAASEGRRSPSTTPQPRRGSRSRQFGGDDRAPREVCVLGKEARDLVQPFFGFERAGAIDKRSARLHEGRRALKDRGLQASPGPARPLLASDKGYPDGVGSCRSPRTAHR